MAIQIRDMTAAQISDVVVTSGVNATFSAPATIFPLARHQPVRVYNSPGSPPYTIAPGVGAHPQSNLFIREVGLLSNFADGLVWLSNADNERAILRTQALALSALDTVTVAPLGTISTVEGSTDVVGIGTNFTSFAAGNLMKFGDFYAEILSITSDTQLTMTSAAPSTQTARSWGLLNALTGSDHSITAGTRTLTGTGSLYTSELSPGDIIRINDQIFTVESIGSDTSLTTKEVAITSESTLGNAGLGYLMSNLASGTDIRIDMMIGTLNCMHAANKFIDIVDIGQRNDAVEATALQMRTLQDITFLTDSINSAFDGSTAYLDGVVKAEFTEDA